MNNYKLPSIIIIMLLQMSFSVKAQKNQAENIGVAVGTAIVAGVAAAITIQHIKEGMESNMVKWVLENKDFENKKEFSLEMIKWDAAKNEDLNRINLAGFLYREANKEPIILLNAMSRGWYNENGVVFFKINVYEIKLEYWSRILKTIINLSKEDDINEVNIDSIPVIDKKGNSTYISIKYLTNITKDGLEFTDEKGNNKKFNFKVIAKGIGHIAKNFDENFKIDFTDGNLNFYLIKTQDLISIKKIL